MSTALVTIVSVLAVGIFLAVGHSPVYGDEDLKPTYAPKGTSWKLGDMDVYETPYQRDYANKILIFVYDMFGLNATMTKQVADTLANKGHFRIIIPDYFRGQPFPIDKYPPQDPQDVPNFLALHQWDNHVKADTLQVINYFKTSETSFGLFGICWGGKIAVGAATDLPQLVKATALIHPAGVTTDMANGVKVPMYLLPSKNEPDMIPFYNILRTNLGEENCGHRRFDNAPHGFFGARANYSDPAQLYAATETIEILDDFFNKKLGNSGSGR